MIDRDTVMALASEAGFGSMLPALAGLPQTWVGADADRLQRFAALIEKKAAEAEREKLNDAMDTFWTMLKECETSADNRDDRVLKHCVEGWYSQYARITGGEIKEPRWIERARGTGGEG